MSPDLQRLQHAGNILKILDGVSTQTPYHRSAAGVGRSGTEALMPGEKQNQTYLVIGGKGRRKGPSRVVACTLQRAWQQHGVSFLEVYLGG